MQMQYFFFCTVARYVCLHMTEQFNKEIRRKLSIMHILWHEQSQRLVIIIQYRFLFINYYITLVEIQTHLKLITFFISIPIASYMHPYKYNLINTCMQIRYRIEAAETSQLTNITATRYDQFSTRLTRN